MSEPSKAWVERVFPSFKGSGKAALILAHGAGYDAGMADATELVMNQFAALGVPREFMEALTENVSIPGERHE